MTDVPNALQTKDAARFRLLRTLYDLTDGTTADVLDYELEEATGLTSDEFNVAENYLRGRGLIDGTTLNSICLTHQGVCEVEDAIRTPEASTDYFPPNIVYIAGNANNAIFQQAGSHSTQTATINAVDVRSFLAELKAKIDDLGLDHNTKDDLTTDIEMVEMQLRKSSPSQDAIKGLLSSIKTVLEGAVGSVVASGLLEMLSRIPL